MHTAISMMKINSPKTSNKKKKPLADRKVKQLKLLTIPHHQYRPVSESPLEN